MTTEPSRNDTQPKYDRRPGWPMTDRRGLAAGISFIVAGIPLVLFYGAQPFGYLGVGLAVLGAAVSYGALQL